jgi:hypothetical protein
MALAPYTTPQLVRAALGVEALEIDDATLNLATYSTPMMEALYEISDTLTTDYATAVADTSPAALTSRFRDLVEAYSTYVVAELAIPSIPLFAPRKIQDDRTNMERIDNPFKELPFQLAKGKAFILSKLKVVYLQYNPDAVIITPDTASWQPLPGVVSEVTDPVVQ